MVAFEGQRAQAAQVFGEHDGVGRVFAWVKLGIDVGEQHGLAGLQHDAAYTMAGRQRDAPVPVACFAGAVHPLQRCADECGDAHGDEVEVKSRAKLLDGALERFVVSVKRCPVEIRSPHALPFRLMLPAHIIGRRCGG